MSRCAILAQCLTVALSALYLSLMPVVICDPKLKTPHRNSVLLELREMQKVAYSLVLAKDTKPSDVAQLMRAHVAAEQQRNILRMRPAPKPIDTTQLANKRASYRSLSHSKPSAIPSDVGPGTPAPGAQTP